MRNIISAAKHRRRKDGNIIKAREDEYCRIYKLIGEVATFGVENIKLTLGQREHINTLIKRLNELNLEIKQCKNAIAELQNMVIDSRVEND